MQLRSSSAFYGRISRILVGLILLLSVTTLATKADGAVGALTDASDQAQPKLSKKAQQEKELNTSLQGLTHSAFHEDMLDGAGFVDKMVAAAESYHDYTFDYTMKVFKNKKTITESGVFYFKKPRLIRLEETGDYKHGAVAILGSNGKVKAHLGGGLKMFTVELDPDSNLLRSANGHPMVESDFVSLAHALKKFLKQGYVSQVTKEAHTMKAEHDNVYILELRKGNLDSNVWKRVAVSSRTHLPLQWWDYDEDGDLWSHANWNEFKPNQQLADSVFDIKTDKNSDKDNG